MHAGSWCQRDDSADAAARASRKRKPARPSPSRNTKQVAAELLSWTCGDKCVCGGKCGFRLHTKVCGVVQQILDARRQLYQAGRKNSTTVLFEKLLQHRQAPPRPQDKFVLNFRFAELEICSDIWCAIHGVKTTDSRIKKVFACLRRGDCHWVPKQGRFQGTHRGWRGDWGSRID